MIRIIAGTAYEIKSSDRFKLTAYELGNGQLEISAVRQMTAVELDWSPMVIQDYLDACARDAEERAVEIAEEKRLRCLRNAAQRAKKRVRHLCKAMGADTLLTLTYRANQTDLDLCKKHLKEFNRRMLRTFPDFRFVAGFERQKRGAWHVHMACLNDSIKTPVRGVKVKSYNVIRAIWRAVTGELEGNIDVSAKKRNSQRKCARIASYISKYITKEYEAGPDYKNRWTKYGDFDVPPKVDLGYVDSLRGALEAICFSVPEGSEIDIFKMDKWRDWAIYHASPVGG